MKLMFDINPSALSTGEAVFAFIFAAIVFVVVPAALAIIEYRLMKKEKKHGMYLMVGVFSSAVLLGIYSLLVGVLLLIVFLAASPKNTRYPVQNMSEESESA